MPLSNEPVCDYTTSLTPYVGTTITEKLYRSDGRKGKVRGSTWTGYDNQ